MIDSVSVRVAETGETYTISADILRRIKVQRDMEIVRKVLLAIEAKADLRPEEIKLSNEDDLTVGRHVELLHSAGMIEGIRSDQINRPYAFILVRDLTWEGHEFAASLRNESVWAQIKAKFSVDELASLPIPAIMAVATAVTTQWAKTKLGF